MTHFVFVFACIRVRIQVGIDSKKRAYSWGFGGLGRLGHAEQKDEMVPRLMKYFDSSARGVRSVFCGSSYSLAITDIGVLFMFGQNKKTGEANMYPKPVQDLSGKNELISFYLLVGTDNRFLFSRNFILNRMAYNQYWML